MSSKPTSPEVLVDAPSTATHVPTPADVWTEPTSPGDAPPFESPEFGVGGFFPHVDEPAEA
ncbi:MAG: hypothetical protein ABR500_06005 [Dermatophilaceae bacterium]|nr:hypothetical protein [Intrasporangiaceae bacterium]